MHKISRIICASFALFFMNSAFAAGQDDDEGFLTPPQVSAAQFYSRDDFYFINKSGKRIVLNIDPGKIVVRFSTWSDASQREKILEEFGLIKTSGEKSIVSFGVSEIKQTAFTDEIIVVRVPNSDEGLRLINSLLLRNGVYDAAPVFLLNGENVFPAGVWVKSKYSSLQEKNNLHSKLIGENYSALWNDYGPVKYPPGVSARLNYFERNGKSFTNPLRLSRLIAQDVLAVWSIPDFVPLKRPIEIVSLLSRPSGTMNSGFEAAYRIKFDPKKVVLDVDGLRSIEPMSIKPKEMPEGFFRAEALKINESPGNIVIRLGFRIYEPGSFVLSPLVVRFNFIGAAENVPPETASSADIRVIIAGLVPRDADGHPTVHDIFGWKKNPIFPPEIPAAPKFEDYPATDIRFYAKGIFIKYPDLGSELTFGAYAIFGVMAFWGAVLLCLSSYRRIVSNRSSVASEFASTGTAKSARRYIREILRAPDGKTNHELLEDCPDELRGILTELIFLLERSAGDERLSEDNISQIRTLAKKLRRGMKWRS